MSKSDIALPPGFRLAQFDALDSTMSEAARQARSGAEGRLWIWALQQNEGRGRSGREWQSLEGNLFTSLLLRLRCPIAIALQLSLVAGIAIYDTVADLGRDMNLPDRLELKWPNDLLLSGEKIAGVLLESFEDAAGGGLVVAIGTGLNLSSHPDNGLYPASDLASHGVSVAPDQALAVLAAKTADWVKRWDLGNGFAQVRAAWLERSLPLGQTLRVRLDGKELIGVYAGIDATGALRLSDETGAERVISAGDVFVTS
jgi:BirA family biotin operon repressor/biotin-[acetyl-CoA-carboxylase] ligase